MARAIPPVLMLLVALLIATAPLPAAEAQDAPGDAGPRFVENVGQWPDAVRFRLMGGGASWAVGEEALWLTAVDAGARGEVRGTQLKLTFDSAAPARWEPAGRSAAIHSFYGGRSSGARHENVPAWETLRWREYRPGVDLVLSTRSGSLAASLIATRDGAVLPPEVPLTVEGAALTGGGARLALRSGDRQYELPLPPGITWAVRQGTAEAAVRSSAPGEREAGAQPLNLLYSSFLGSEATDELYMVEGRGDDIYMVGYTAASIFPTRPGRFVEHVIDVLVARVNVQNPNDRFVTILLAEGGGDLEEFGNAMALDPAGNVYVVGYTNSDTFPTTPGAYDETFNGNFDAYAAKLSPNGSLIYSTFIGGADLDIAKAVGVHDNGTVSVTGSTFSTDFPVTAGAVYNQNAGIRDAWIARLSADWSTLEYSTYLGGELQDEITAIQVQGDQLIMTGWTSSPDWPTTAGAHDTTHNGSFDSFVTRLTPGAATLTYSTFLGGAAEDRGWDLVVDGAGRVSVVGSTRSSDFPVTPGSFGSQFGGGICIPGNPPTICSDGFLARFSASGSALEVSGFFGGDNQDTFEAVDLDLAGNYHLTGTTQSPNLPVTSDAYDSGYNGGIDAVIAQVSASGAHLLYATYLGSSDEDEGFDIDWQPPDRLYIAGQTESPDFPIAGNAYNPTHNGDADGFYMLWQSPTASVSQLYLPAVLR